MRYDEDTLVQVTTASYLRDEHSLGECLRPQHGDIRLGRDAGP